MTLSRWLRDYLYFPLGGNRGGRWQTHRNLLITMALGGLWHGAGGTFVVWGMYHGLGLMGERVLSDLRGEADRPLQPADIGIRELALLHSGASVDAWSDDPTSPVPFTPMEVRSRWIGRLVTFHFVAIGWIIFNADSLGRAWEVFAGVFRGWTTAPVLLNPLVALAIVGSLAVQFVPPMLARQWSAMFSTISPPVIALGFAVWVMVVVALGPAACPTSSTSGSDMPDPNRDSAPFTGPDAHPRGMT